MAPATRASTDLQAGNVSDVVNNIVGAGRVATDAGRHKVQVQNVPRFPCDVVIRTGRVAAHADRSDQDLARVIKSKSAAKNIDSADALPDHGVASLAVV